VFFVFIVVKKAFSFVFSAESVLIRVHLWLNFFQVSGFKFQVLLLRLLCLFAAKNSGFCLFRPFKFPFLVPLVCLVCLVCFVVKNVPLFL